MSPKGKSGLYLRGKVWWMHWYDEAQARQSASTGKREKAEALKVLQAVEREVIRNIRLGVVTEGPPTFERRSGKWIADRKRRGVASAKDDAGRLRHAMPTLGHLLVTDIRPGHIKDLFRELRMKCGPGKDQMAPRSVRHVYGVLRTFFGDLVADELIPANPCVLKRGDLPKKVDKDPLWRRTAVYTREEVEQLISDERIPENRRVLYALIFLGGMRIGEAAARQWSDYDATIKPLGRMGIASSFNRKENRLKPVKSQVPRELPVHPALAQVLARWKLGGWAGMMGRAPRAEDLIIPSSTGRFLQDPVVLEKLHADLDTLGLRRRRTHDARRTLVSLALGDGARKDILEWITHGPKGDIMSLYTTLPWESLCAEISKLKIGLLEGRLLSMPKTLNAGGDLVQSWYSPPAEIKRPPSLANLEAQLHLPRAGLEPAEAGNARHSETTFGGVSPLAGDSRRSVEPSEERRNCTNVPAGLPPIDPRDILEILRALLGDHQTQDPHHEDMCGLCIRTKAAISILEKDGGSR